MSNATSATCPIVVTLFEANSIYDFAFLSLQQMIPTPKQKSSGLNFFASQCTDNSDNRECLCGEGGSSEIKHQNIQNAD